MSWSPADDEDGQGNHHPGGCRMVPMYPTSAQLILKGAELSGEDLGIGYRRALETIAGMRAEYQVQRQFAGEWYPCQLDADGMTWTEDQTVADEYADTCRTRSIPVRIVRRHVGPWEEA